MLKSAYRAFARQCYLIIELMRQFYDEQRVFRITGQRGESEFVPFSAQGLRAKPVPAVGGVELGSREPVFDIVVSAAKKHLQPPVPERDRQRSAISWASLTPPTRTLPLRRWK